MKWFVQKTRGKPVIVGRKTFESFGGKPLKDRPTIVVTRDPDYQANGGICATSVEDALDKAKANLGDQDEIMVIGGASFYERMLAQTDRLYLTLVDAEVDGDARFPEFDLTQWREVFSEHHAADDKNEHAYTFKIFEKNRKGVKS
jgi:dihydrofolate reductase